MKKHYLLICSFLLLGIGGANAQFTDLLGFSGANGNEPFGSLTLSVTGKMLYGMTYIGGANNKGCIFAIDTNGNGYRDLWDFKDTTTNGANPYSSLILSASGNVLYGTTYKGGINNYGIVFSIDTDGTNFKDLWNFDDVKGAYPLSALTLSPSGNQLFGMTRGDGITNFGNIFSIDITGANYKDLWDFSDTVGTNGEGGVSQLVLAGNVLYGMTIFGGTSSRGIICSIDTDGSRFKDIWNFADTGTNGSEPSGSLTLVGGKLYGMTSQGGVNKDGLIFSIDTTGNGYKDVWDFSLSPSNGDNPLDGSLLLSGSTFYGMTYAGGYYSYGLIFSVDTNGTGFSDLYDFNNSTTSGEGPYGSLTLEGKVLYGMTSLGNGSDGIVFGFRDDNISTSINQLTTNKQVLNVYPNPNNGIFNIALGASKLVSEPQTIVEVYNVLGEKVYEAPFKQVQGGNLINISDAPSGVYLYRVISENGILIGEGKVIVQK